MAKSNVFSKLFGNEVITIFAVSVLFLTKEIHCDTQKLAISNEIGNTGSAASLSSGSASSNAISNINGQQYRQYYPVAPDAVQNSWNRDSYVNAASELGANNYQPAQHGSTHSSSFFPTSDYGAEGNSFDLDGLGLGGAGLGGLGGLAGILGIKGIKGLGLLGLLKLVGIPLLLLAIPAILLLPLLFFFLPVPVITLPADPNGVNGRSFGVFNFSDISGKMTHLARSVLDSDKCIERISCEMSSYSRGSLIDRALKKVIYRFETSMPQTLKRMARAYMEQPSSVCNKKYSCYLIDDSVTKKST